MTPELTAAAVKLRKDCTDRLAAIEDKEQHQYALVTVQASLIVALLPTPGKADKSVAAILARGCAAAIAGKPDEERDSVESHIAPSDILAAIAGKPDEEVDSVEAHISPTHLLAALESVAP